MLSLRARTVSCLCAALIAVGCVEVEVRKTLGPDLSGRQTITLRAPKAANADAFPGVFSGATCLPPTRQAAGDLVAHTAVVVFPNVSGVRHQVEFLSSAVATEPASDGGVAYRETLTNSYFKSLGRAPSEEARKSIAATIEETMKKLAGARLTYTIQFPGPVTKSNADTANGHEATWVLTADKLFTGRALELSAEFRTAPAPIVASAALPAGVVPVSTAAAPAPEPKPAPKAEAKPEPKAEAKPEPAPQPKPAAAPAPRPEPAPAAPAPAPVQPPVAKAPAATETPVTRPSSDLAGILLAQADEPAAKEAPAAKAQPPAAKEEPAAKQAPPEAPKKEAPKRPKKAEETTELAPPPLPKKTPVDIAEAAGDDPATAEVKKLFRDALVHLDYKRYDKAAESLQKAVGLQPNSVLIANLYEQVVAKFLDAALDSKSPELKAQAEALQKIAYQGRLQQLRDPARVKELVEALQKGFLPRTFAIEELTIAGDYAVPHLLKFMIGHTDPELRAYAGHILSRMRGPAVPAICEALKHNDPMIRQVLVLALEIIGDPRSTPTLLWLAQEPDGHPLVIAGAKRALAKLSGGPALLQTPAAAAFLELAKDYYDGNRKVIDAHLYEHLVWHYDPAKKELAAEAVPQNLYAYRVAEGLCRNALMANPDYEPAIPLLICACFAQQNLLDVFFTSIAAKKDPTKEEQDEAALAKPLQERLAMAPAIAQAAGKKFAYAALQQALRDGKVEVAISCIRVLQQVADAASLPGPALSEEELQKAAAEKKRKDAPKRKRILIWYGPEQAEESAPPPSAAKPHAIQLDGSPLADALSYPDRRVRYAAAEAIVAMKPTQAFRDAAKVPLNLAQALSESAYHVALLVDDDEVMAEELRPLLRDAGVMPVLVRTQTDAVTAARDLPPKDLVIVNGGLKRMDVAELIANVRRVYTMAASPVIVVTTKSEEPKLREKLAKENATFVIRPFVAGAVRAAIEDLLKGAPEPKNKEASARYAASAARALAAVDSAASVLRLDEAIGAITEAIATTTQPDTVRIPCCEAARHAANPRAIPYLAQACADPGSSKELKVAALHALGACAGSQANLAPDMAKRVADVLTAASMDADPDFRRAAALGYGLKGGATGDFDEVIARLYGDAKQPAPAVKPPEKPEAAPAEKPAEKPVAAPAEKPAEKAEEKPAEKKTE